MVPRGARGARNDAVSEVIGTLILVGVVITGMTLVGVILLSRPPPTKVPVLDAIISNESKAIYLYHKGGDRLLAGEYRILVDGEDQTLLFNNSGGLSASDLNWSVGQTLSYTSTASEMPARVVILFSPGDTGGGGAGSGNVLAAQDLLGAWTIPTTIVVHHYLNVGWSRSPAFANTTTPIYFTDTSIGTDITDYFWNFNEGSTNTTKNPDHTFSSCGQNPCLYSINHSVTTSGGTSWAYTGWLNRSSYVTVYKDPWPSVTFTQNVTSGTIHFGVAFTATPSGPIRVDEWSWTFGDGGTSTSQNPTHTYTCAGTYTVTLKATNYTLGTNTTTKTNLIQAVNPPGPAWYNSLWGYRKNITINKTAVSGSSPLTNFPVLISVTDTGLRDHARTNGYDILFTNSAGVKLPHEIEKYTSTTGLLVAWVNVTSISPSANTSIFMYYGYSSASNQQDKTHVWDANYKGVWHLGEGGTGTRYDSTSNGNNLNPHNYEGGEGITTGKIDGADDLSQGYYSHNDHLESASNIGISGSTARTISYWARLDDTNRCGMVGWGAESANNEFEAAVRNSHYFLWGYGSSNDWSDIANPVTSWKYYTIVYDGSTVSWYLDKTLLGTHSHTYATTNGHVIVGYESDSTMNSYTYMNGAIDEIRVSNMARSRDWMNTSFTNQASPLLFHYEGSEERAPVC